MRFHWFWAKHIHPKVHYLSKTVTALGIIYSRSKRRICQMYMHFLPTNDYRTASFLSLLLFLRVRLSYLVHLLISFFPLALWVISWLNFISNKFAFFSKAADLSLFFLNISYHYFQIFLCLFRNYLTSFLCRWFSLLLSHRCVSWFFHLYLLIN